jgi:filamentous hemagglutinin family protein
MHNDSGIAFLRAGLAIALVLQAAPIFAQVQTDGSMGPVTALSGNMVIDSSLGKQAGTNLFHSFSLFNIRTGESATFTSSLPGSISNVIARVTGGELSSIDGLLSSKISGANLYLFNPNGIAFGKNATIDVRGSFHASTADYIAFKDGSQFKAKPDSLTGATLTVASPAAFGFLNSKPAPITVSQSVLNSAYGAGLSLVGGDITIDGGHMNSDMGRIDLVSVASTGEAALNSAGAMNVSSFGTLGEISIKNESLLQVSEDFGPGGSVYIRGGRFFLDASKISSSSFLGPPGPIDIAVKGDATLSNGGEIYSEIFDGIGGDILISSGSNINITGGSMITSLTYGESGHGGKIKINAGGDLRIADASQISAITNFGSARGGDVTISLGGDLTVIDGSWIKAEAFMAAGFWTAGSSGNISIDARNVKVVDGGSIFTSSFLSAPGRAGDISIKASDTISISTAPGGLATGISSNPAEFDFVTPSMGVGGAGSIKLESKALTMDSGFISTKNDWNAATGNITINVSSLKLNGGAFISASTVGAGDGGKLTIQASDAVTLAGSSRLESGSWSSGSGGAISITARNLVADSSSIDSSASSSGHAGDVKIAVDNFEFKGSSIETGAKSSAGGNITIGAADMFQLQNSTISASANSVTPLHNGGNVTIGTPQFFILNRSSVLARANAGNGGNIKLAADYFLRSSDSLISASSQRGIDGQILIESPNEVTGTVTVLEVPSLDVSALLQERCAAAVLRERSSFTIEGRGGLPPRPGGFLTSPSGGKASGTKKMPGAAGTTGFTSSYMPFSFEKDHKQRN